MGLFGPTLTNITVPFSGEASAQFVGLKIEMDATVSTNDDISTTVTDHPVEDGANIADHIRDEPDKLTIEGIVTRTPVENPISLLLESGTRQEEAWQQLQAVQKAHVLVDVDTPVASYTDMAIERLARVRNAGVGEALQVTINLKKIVKVVATEAALPARAEGVQKSKISNGAVTPAPQLQSGLFSLVH